LKGLNGSNSLNGSNGSNRFLEYSAMRITTLLLDIGGVLLTNGWGRTSRKLAAETFNLDHDDMEERHHLTFDTYEEGKLSLDEYLNRVVFHKACCFSRDEFKAFMFDQSRSFPEMIDMIKKLKAKHALKIAAVNNEGRELSLYRIAKFNLSSFIDFFVSSCFVHFRKPDADIFRMAVDMAQTPVRECLYVDDRLLFVEVAKSLGISGIHHRQYDETVKALEAFGLSL
jgi:putative hydrolase of the HAD superfamily